MIAGIADVLGSERNYYLCDSFEGLPPAENIDGPAAIKWQSDKEAPGYHNNCAAPIEYAKEAMAMARIDTANFIKGWYEHTLPELQTQEQIALLRLDADWYSSTMLCLESLYKHVATNGIIILDDYFTWDGCSRALHEFLAKHQCVERISSHHGVSYIRKK